MKSPGNPLLSAMVGVLCGLGAALFLVLLDLATDAREATPSLVYALPLAGLAMGAFLDRYAGAATEGSDLVIRRIRDRGDAIPMRLAPIALFGTVFTHLFGGSAGREGTAVQIGASFAANVARRLSLGEEARRSLLIAGVAGGFGAVFGTPLAGAVFAVEFVHRGSVSPRVVLPALIAAVAGDLTTRSLGIEHTLFPVVESLPMTLIVLGKWVVFAAAAAVAAIGFVLATKFVRSVARRISSRRAIRMFLGGLLVVILWRLAGTSDYLGLGVPTIVAAFSDEALPGSAWLMKLMFTAVTIGSGFLGGEVTPLFFIGATLGNTLAQLLGLPIAMGAGVGMAAIFASGSKAPLALSIMAVELLGLALLPHVAIVCIVARLLSGRFSIYEAHADAEQASA